MKEYKKPEMNVIKFTVEDIMSNSSAVDTVKPIVPPDPGTQINPTPTQLPGWNW